MALDMNYINEEEFNKAYDHAGQTCAAIFGFINYLSNYKP